MIVASMFLSWETLYWITVGACGAIIAAITLKLANYFTAKPKIVWCSSNYTVKLSQQKGKQTYASFNELIIDNIGRGIAKKIVVSIKGEVIGPKLQRQKFTWTSSNSIQVYDDASVVKDLDENNVTISFNNLSGRTRAIIKFGSYAAYGAHISAVTYDEYIGRDVYKPITVLTLDELLLATAKSMLFFSPLVLLVGYWSFKLFSTLVDFILGKP